MGVPTVSSIHSSHSRITLDTLERQRSVRRDGTQESTDGEIRSLKRRRKTEDYHINAHDIDDEDENGETERMRAESEKAHLAEWEEQIDDKVNLKYNLDIAKVP